MHEMRMKSKILTVIVCVVIVATFAVAFMVEKGLGASAESYGVYVQAAGTVIKLAPDGTQIMRLPKEKLGIPEAGGVAINQVDGTIWVWSYSGGMTAVAHLSADGEEILASWTISQGWVKNLAVDPTDGSVWLSPGYDSYTFKYSADGALLCTLTSPHTHWCPSISVNPAEQTVWMTDGAAGRVIKLRSDGHLILSLSGFSVGWIHHVSVDQTDGSVWVADQDHNEVVKLDTNGDELVRVNVGSMPFFVVANPVDGGVWVAFWSEGPVKRLDSSGNVIATSAIIIPGSWVRGLDIAPDGTVWVAETFAHKLHKLSPTGELLLTIDGDPATFYRPQFVCACIHADVTPPSPVGGKATPINIPMNQPETPALWTWLTTIILSLVLTVVYVKKRKRDTEINS